MTTLFDPEKHKRTRERLKKLNSFQPFNIPTELTFIGDKKPYVINNKEYKHKKYAKQALKELLKTFPLDLALNLKESTMLKVINQDIDGDIVFEMKRWNKSGGQILPGLITRRDAEAEMWLGLGFNP